MSSLFTHKCLADVPQVCKLVAEVGLVSDAAVRQALAHDFDETVNFFQMHPKCVSLFKANSSLNVDTDGSLDIKAQFVCMWRSSYDELSKFIRLTGSITPGSKMPNTWCCGEGPLFCMPDSIEDEIDWKHMTKPGLRFLRAYFKAKYLVEGCVWADTDQGEDANGYQKAIAFVTAMWLVDDLHDDTAPTVDELCLQKHRLNRIYSRMTSHESNAPVSTHARLDGEDAHVDEEEAVVERMIEKLMHYHYEHLHPSLKVMVASTLKTYTDYSIPSAHVVDASQAKTPVEAVKQNVLFRNYNCGGYPFYTACVAATVHFHQSALPVEIFADISNHMATSDTDTEFNCRHPFIRGMISSSCKKLARLNRLTRYLCWWINDLVDHEKDIKSNVPNLLRAFDSIIEKTDPSRVGPNLESKIQAMELHNLFMIPEFFSLAKDLLTSEDNWKRCSTRVALNVVYGVYNMHYRHPEYNLRWELTYQQVPKEVMSNVTNPMLKFAPSMTSDSLYAMLMSDEIACGL